MSVLRAIFERCEPFGASKSARKKVVQRLASDGTVAARALARRLGQCHKGRRCLSGACPVCAREYRFHLLSQVERVLGSERPWTWLSCLPPEGVFDIGRLAEINFEDLQRRQRHALEVSLPGVVAVGGFEICLECTDAAEPRLHVRSSVIVAAQLSSKLCERICEAHQTHADYEDALILEGIVEPWLALSNTFEHFIFTKSYQANGETGTRINYGSMTGKEAVKMDLLQDRWPLWDRLITHGVDVVRNYPRPRLQRK